MIGSISAVGITNYKLQITNYELRITNQCRLVKQLDYTKSNKINI